MHWSDYLGWFGFVVLLCSYLMVALRVWHIRSIPSQLGNMIGPASLGINSAFHQATVPIVLNIFWFSIATFTLFRILRHDKQPG